MRFKSTEVLTKARELIAEHGWAQHTHGNQRVGFSAEGALREATKLAVAAGAPIYTAARRRLVTTIIEQDGYSGWNTLNDWNDVDGRTVEDVLDAYDKTIDKPLPT